MKFFDFFLQVVVRNGGFVRGNSRLFAAFGGRDFLNNQVQPPTPVNLAGAADVPAGTSGDGAFG